MSDLYKTNTLSWEDVSRIALALPETLPELDEVIVEAWLSRAPARLAREYIDARLTPTEE